MKNTGISQIFSRRYRFPPYNLAISTIIFSEEKIRHKNWQAKKKQFNFTISDDSKNLFFFDKLIQLCGLVVKSVPG